MTIDDALGLPADLLQKAVATLVELTAISSASGEPAGLNALAERLAAELQARGLQTEVRQTPAAGATLPVLYARGPGAGSGFLASSATGAPSDAAAGPPAGAAADGHGHLLLIGHMDTVLPAAPPRREADRLIATGAVDMKGGLVTLLGALDLLARRGAAPPADLLLAVVPDEEVGGELSRATVAACGAAARALWVLEPGEPGSAPGAETAVGGRRGMFNWRLLAEGRSAHSGLHFAAGRSALLAAARWSTAAASDPTANRTALQAPTVNIGRLVAGDASFVGNLAQTHDFVGTERQLNVVPDRAIVEGEVRFTRPTDAQAATSTLINLAADVAAQTETTLRFTRGATVPPVDPHGPQRPILARAVALAAARGWHLQVEEERGGISFPNFLPNPGHLPVLDGLGPIGGGMHTRDEYVDLLSLRRRIVLLADLLAEDAEARCHA
jgi:glutamate carboxypeptidase